MEATELALIRLSLKDRQNYLKKNKGRMKEYKGKNQFHPLTTNVAAGKSGALLWAHRHNILGKGAEIFVIEVVGYLSPDAPLSKVIRTTSPFHPKGINWEALTHATAVASVVYQVAPQAHITLIQDSQLEIFFHPRWRTPDWDEQRKRNLFPEHPLILNWSGGVIPEHRIGGIKGFFESRAQRGDLLIKAVANSAGFGGDVEIDHMFNERVFDHHFSQIILVGNLGEYGELPVKPFNARQSSRFLCGYGNEILVTEDNKMSGTSFAAPTVAGSVALLKNKYPHLTLLQIGDILLESAEKTFWIGLGRWRPTLVYDPQDFPEGPAGLLRLPEGVELVPFDSMKYGKGILNLRRAFLYADLKVKHPQLSFEELAPLFKAAVQAQETLAAQKIQRAFRAHKGKKPL